MKFAQMHRKHGNWEEIQFKKKIFSEKFSQRYKFIDSLPPIEQLKIVRMNRKHGNRREIHSKT